MLSSNRANSSPFILTKRPSQPLLERQIALEERGAGKAAHLIKEAIVGYRDAPYAGYYNPYGNEQKPWRNRISIICGQLANNLKGVTLICSWVLFILSFFEPPHWCRDASDLQIIDYQDDQVAGDKGYGDCKLLLNSYGETADGQENEELYPNSSTMWLTINQSRHIEMACVCFITLYWGLKFGDDGFVPHLFFYPGYKRWTNVLQCIVLISLFISAIFDITTYNPFLRMLVLGSLLRRFQQELFTFLKMVSDP